MTTDFVVPKKVRKMFILWFKACVMTEKTVPFLKQTTCFLSFKKRGNILFAISRVFFHKTE